MNENMSDSLPQRYRAPSIYIGKDLNESVHLLMAVLKEKGTTLGAVLRPELERLIAEHQAEIDAKRKKLSN